MCIQNISWHIWWVFTWGKTKYVSCFTKPCVAPVCDLLPPTPLCLYVLLLLLLQSTCLRSVSWPSYLHNENHIPGNTAFTLKMALIDSPLHDQWYCSFFPGVSKTPSLLWNNCSCALWTYSHLLLLILYLFQIWVRQLIIFVSFRMQLLPKGVRQLSSWTDSFPWWSQTDVFVFQRSWRCLRVSSCFNMFEWAHHNPW